MLNWVGRFMENIKKQMRNMAIIWVRWEAGRRLSGEEGGN